MKRIDWLAWGSLALAVGVPLLWAVSMLVL
jgi:hypothetical protein